MRDRFAPACCAGRPARTSARARSRAPTARHRPASSPRRAASGALAGHRGDDAAHVGPEAHVHHAVGFVEHEQLDAGQVRVLLPHVIDQPARRGDDDVDAGAERAFLAAHFDAAVDGRARDRRVVRRGRGFRPRSARRARASARGRARGSSRRAGPSAPLGTVSSRCSVGTTKAQVLPVPVSAHAMRSSPASASRNDRALDRPGFGESEVADAFEQPRVEVRATRTGPASCRRASARAPARAASAGRGAGDVRCLDARGPRAAAGAVGERSSIGCVGIQTVFG